MKLSVIIPSYKFQSYLKECIDSVLQQKCNFALEILIRDDGTNDGTFEHLKLLYGNNPLIKILDSSENLGAPKNILRLIDTAVGEYIAYIDGDDCFIDPDYLQRSVDFLDKNKECSTFCGGYRYLEDGRIYPENIWMTSGKEIINLTDLLVHNYVSFGRVFRKIKVNPEIFDGVSYPDWALNFELLKIGKAICDKNHCVGLYRMHNEAMFSKKTEEEKLADNVLMKKELTRRFEMHQTKVISIVDAYIHNDAVKSKLNRMLDWLKADGHDTLFISNTFADKELVDKVKFYIYDSRNQLFSGKYDDMSAVDLWRTLDHNTTIHDIVIGLQKHGLSVLINLFNALTYAKHQGYTHFQRFEADDLYGEKSRETIKKIPIECIEKSKKGLFYCNRDEVPPDVSFHYFYCEIDYFLEKVKRISQESDYVDYLKECYNNKRFQIVEVFIHDQLKRNNTNLIVWKNGKEDMAIDFPDTSWNTENSISSFDPKYQHCTTKIYKAHRLNKTTGEYDPVNYNIVASYMYKDKLTARKIIVNKKNGETSEIKHEMLYLGQWVWHRLPDDAVSVSVYQNGEYLYTDQVDDCISFVNFES